MHELPVIATTAAAYRLVLRELATIARLSWATLFIVALLQYLLARTVFGQMAAALGRGDVFAAAAIGLAWSNANPRIIRSKRSYRGVS